jgi:predicted nucleic acid-binding protein
MNVVDSSGWLEYLGAGANADFLAAAIKESETLVVPAVCIYEVFRRVAAQRGEEAALEAVGLMSLGTIADLTREIAVSAAVLAAELKMGMADSIVLATARAFDATLWTQDADLNGLPGVRYI